MSVMSPTKQLSPPKLMQPISPNAEACCIDRLHASIPSEFMGGWNELTAVTAHARVGIVVHTQLVRSSLWKERNSIRHC